MTLPPITLLQFGAHDEQLSSHQQLLVSGVLEGIYLINNKFEIIFTCHSGAIQLRCYLSMNA